MVQYIHVYISTTTWLESERETEEQQMVGCAMQKSRIGETHALAVHCVSTADNAEKIGKYEIVANA